MLNAETYALYFANLGNRVARIKTTITFATFLLSSAVAGAVIGKLPAWVPLWISVVIAVLTAYSVATGIDTRAKALIDVHSGLSRNVSTGYGLCTVWLNKMRSRRIDTSRTQWPPLSPNPNPPPPRQPDPLPPLLPPPPERPR